MKNYFKKFSIMFVMALAIIGVGAISNGIVANAAESDYTPKKDYSANLVANYKFEEKSGNTCIDSAGNYNGTYNGTTSVVGGVGNARSFNGTSDYISFNNQVLPLGKKTIKFKIKFDNKPSKDEYIMENSNQSSDFNGIRIQISQDGRICIASDRGITGTYRYSFEAPNMICDNVWHTVVLTWDGTTDVGTVKFYIDNLVTPVVEVTASATETVNASKYLSIGRSNNSYYYGYLKGELDELEIYNDVVEYVGETNEISLDNSVIDLKANNSKQITATTTPADIGVTWASSDPSIATVDSTGKVTGVKEGTCIITATTTDGLTATCTVTVTKQSSSTNPNGNTGTTTGNSSGGITNSYGILNLNNPSGYTQNNNNGGTNNSSNNSNNNNNSGNSGNNYSNNNNSNSNNNYYYYNNYYININKTA